MLRLFPCETKEASKGAKRGAIIENAFFAVERAGAKMGDMLTNTLMLSESSNLFIAGSWKRQIGDQWEKDDLSLPEKEN